MRRANRADGCHQRRMDGTNPLMSRTGEPNQEGGRGRICGSRHPLTLLPLPHLPCPCPRVLGAAGGFLVVRLVVTHGSHPAYGRAHFQHKLALGDVGVLQVIDDRFKGGDEATRLA